MCWIDFQTVLDKHPKQWPEALKKVLEVEVDEEGQDEDEENHGDPEDF